MIGASQFRTVTMKRSLKADIAEIWSAGLKDRTLAIENDPIVMAEDRTSSIENDPIEYYALKIRS